MSRATLYAELAGHLDDDGHSGQLDPRQLVVDDGPPEHDPIGGVFVGRLIGGLHDPDGTGRRLEAAVLESLHLQVEAPADAVGTTDEVGVGNEPVLEGDLVGVHAPVSDGVDGPTFHAAHGSDARVLVGVLGEHKAMAVASRLGHDEERQSLVAEAAIRIGPRQQHQDLGPGRERAPRLDAVHPPAAVGRGGGRGHRRDV